MFHIFCFEIKRYVRKIGMLFSLLFFFVIAISLFPFGVGTSSETLATIAPGITWVCVLLSSLIASQYLFAEDYEDGTLAQLYLSGIMKEWITLAKMCAHWCVTALPIIIVTPLAGQLLHFDYDVMEKLLLGLLAATPALTAISALGASLTVGLRRQQALTSIIILPLYIPFIIFGVSAIDNDTAILLLSGITLFIFWVSLIASSAALKAALEES